MTADKVRAHIVKDVILRQHISSPVFYMNGGDSQGMIADSGKDDLAAIRIEEDITHDDSAQKTKE